ncbi:MAG: ABC transporter permease [Anaerolineae bacterium]
MTASTSAVPLEMRPARLSLWSRILRNFWVRRGAKALFTIFFVVSLTFFLVRLMPGSPIEIYINSLIEQYGIPYDEAKNQAAALFAIDLDAPLYMQYLSYLKNLLRGDLGTSLISAGTPVSTIILRFLPWTIFSVGIGLILSFSLGILLGMFMAYRRESPLDHVLSAFASIVSSVPNYLIAMMLVVFLGVQWKLVDIAAMRGSMSPGMQPGFNMAFIKDALYHASLPIVTYVITTIGTWMLTMKSSTISTLGEDYVTVAKARGLPERRITLAYVGRNATLPLFTQLTIAIGFIVGGSLLIESVFVYQGIGLILLRSITQRDYSVMQGVFLIITISVIVANLLADVLYSRLDPRIKLGRGE